MQAAGRAILRITALGQVLAAAGLTFAGVLRGAGDTRRPLLWNLVGHWLLGLPVGYYLCFVTGYGVVGLWVGLSLGLIIVGTILLGVWARLSSRWLREGPGSTA